MKKMFVVILAVLILSACAPVQGVAQKVVAMPEALQVAITSLCVFAVGWVFSAIGNALPWFTKLFGQYADEIAFAIAGALVAVIQNWLALIPPAWEGVGNVALLLIVEVIAALSALQVYRLFGKAGLKSFRK